MTQEIARKILMAKQKLANAKAAIELHQKVAAAASDELLSLLSDPSIEQALQFDANPPKPEPPPPPPTPGIRDVSSGVIVAKRANEPAVVR